MGFAADESQPSKEDADPIALVRSISAISKASSVSLHSPGSRRSTKTITQDPNEVLVVDEDKEEGAVALEVNSLCVDSSRA